METYHNIVVLIIAANFLLLHCGLIASEETTDVFTECLQEYAIDADTIDAFYTTGEILDESNRLTKCLFFCINRKLSLADEKGTINKQKVKQLIMARNSEFNADKVTSVVDECAKRNETDICDKWYEFSKCHIKAYLDYEKEKN